MLESLHWRIELIFKILLFVLWEFSDLLVRLWSLKFLKFLLGLVFRSKTVGCSMFMRLNELKSPEDLMKQDEQNSSSRCFHPSNDAWSLTLFFTHPLNSEGFAASYLPPPLLLRLCMSTRCLYLEDLGCFFRHFNKRSALWFQSCGQSRLQRESSLCCPLNCGTTSVRSPASEAIFTPLYLDLRHYLHATLRAAYSDTADF